MAGDFCDSQLWNTNYTWTTTDPDFTPCFQKTVILWIPCAYLFVVAPYHIYDIRQNKQGLISTGWLNLTKMFLCIFLALVPLFDIIKSIQEFSSGTIISTVNFISPLIHSLTLVLALLLLHLDRKHGVQTSGFLVTFWILLTLAGIIVFQHKLRIVFQDGEVKDVFRFVLFYTYFPAVVFQLVLAGFVDKKPSFSELGQDPNPCPENGASFLSRITFWWFTGLVVKGYKRGLEKQDMWSLDAENSCSQIVPSFSQHWQNEVDAIKRRKPEKKQDPIELKCLQEDGHLIDEIRITDGEKEQTPSLLMCLVKTFGTYTLVAAFFKFIFDALVFINPFLLKLMIQFTKDKSEYLWRGFLYASLMFIVALLQSLVLHQYFHGCFVLGMRLRTSIITAVYRKMLKLSNSAKRQSTVGEIVNLMSVDAQRLMDLTTYLHMIWSGPLQISLCLYFLWQILGPSVLAGLGFMILLIPVNAFIASKYKILQAKQMQLKDSRIKVMNEVLNGIKVLKLYAWEPSFEKKILGIRNDELLVLKKAAYLNACNSFTWSSAPVLVSLITFAVFVMTDTNNVLDAEKAFVSLSLFNILRFPISIFPQIISQFVQVRVSLKRLRKFLSYEELDPKAVKYDACSKYAVSVKDGTFSWDKGGRTTLRNIQLQITPGSMVAVVGAVGMGKSSLLSAILGEMERMNGSISVKGTVAYVAQISWIQNATLRDNILFGKHPVETDYRKIVEACALNPDLEILPDGDQTEIGEKGINLSGGQKQRVSLARAVYQDSDIYLLDDPLSAVDSHVGKHIFENVIGPNGLLKNKTRILVTHGINFLPKMDNIVVLVDGQISEVGSYQQLLDHKGAFAKFLRDYLCHEMAEDDSDIDDIDELEVEERQELVKQLCSVMDEQEANILKRQVSELSSRIRTLSETSKSTESLSASPQSFKNYLASSSPYLRHKSKSRSEMSLAETKEIIKETRRKDAYKLIQEENIETGNVKMSVFLEYIQSIGIPLSVAILVFYVLYNGIGVYSNIWLSEWSDDPRGVNGTVDTAQRDMRLGVYGGICFVQGLFAMTGTWYLYIGHVWAGRRLHKRLLVNLLASPLTFFDSTPSGRIINRSGKDIDLLDNTMPRQHNDLLNCFLRTVSIPIVVGYGTPVFLTMFVPLILLGAAIQKVAWDVKLIFHLSSGIVTTVSAFIMAYAGVVASRVLYARLLHCLLRNSMQFYNQTPIGRLINRCSEDIADVDYTLHFTVRSMVNVVLLTALTLGIIIYATPLFTFTLPPFAVIYFYIQRFYVATARQLRRLESASRSPIYSHFGETILGVGTIRAFRQQERFIVESEAKIDENQVCYYPSIVANRWLALRLELVGNCIVFFAALFAVLARDSLSAGLVGLSITYSLNVTQMLNWLVRMTCELETNIVAVERIKEYSETPNEAAWIVPDNRPSHDWPNQGRIQFQNYGTRYREGLDLVLKGIDCDIKPKEKIGIVGRTGAGKSSLTLALFRIIEAAQGAIYIDGINIANIGLHDLRSKLTIIPQEPVMFSGSLRINLDPFDDCTDDAIWQALEQAHLKTFVSELDNKLLHECTEGGENLSVGQRQLICLARAILRKSKILILDEATAAVDLKTDDLIQQTLRIEFEDCTVLTIAHRLNTIMDYTRVMVLDGGKIQEFDSPKILLQNSESFFFRLAHDAGLVS